MESFVKIDRKALGDAIEAPYFEATASLPHEEFVQFLVKQLEADISKDALTRLTPARLKKAHAQFVQSRKAPAGKAAAASSG